MTLDIPTLFITLTLGLLLLVVELAVALRHWARDAALRDWTLGGWWMVVGLALSAARAQLPEAPAMVAGNTALCMGGLLLSQAIYRFIHGDQPWRWMRWALPLCLVLMLVILPWPLRWRVVVVSGLLALCLLPGVVMIFRTARQLEHSLIAVGLMLGLTTLALAGRALHALWQPQHYLVFNQAGMLQSLIFLLAFLALQGAGWGFVLSVLERTARRMQEQATQDSLTGCYNRGTGEIMLAHELQRGRRENTPVALVLMDLDHFKVINDRFGHRMGDSALRLFARTVQERLRHADLLCRMGGGEFGLILSDTDEAGALRLVDKVRVAVRMLDLRSEQNETVLLDFSAGVAVAVPGQAGAGNFSADRLYGRADNAMYEAKHAGRGRTMAAAGR